MIYTINFIKRAGFFKRTHPILKEEDGVIQDTGREYKKPSAPGAVRMVRPNYNQTKRRYVTGYSQEELNNLVKEIRLIDPKTSQPIVTADAGNIKDPFFTHKELVFSVESGNAILDDDIALDKFFLGVFKNDKRFKFAGEDLNPALSSRVEYRINKGLASQDSEKSAELDESLRAVELLQEMSYERQLDVLEAMGTRVETHNPDPTFVKKALYRLISHEKNSRRFGSDQTNIERFIILAGSTTTQLNIEKLVGISRTKNIIKKDVKGNYMFGDYKLGRTLKEVHQYLNEVDNADIKDLLTEAAKDVDIVK